MPPGRYWNVEWLNQNAQRNYPLSEEATLRDENDSFELPNDLIVDLVWPVHVSSTVLPGLFHIINVGVFSNGVSISIGYNGITIASVSIPATGFESNSTYYIQGTGDFYDSLGTITIGHIETAQQTPGSWTFDLAGGRLEPSVVRPDLRGVSGVIVVNGSDRSERITGDVVFEAGQNFKIDYIAATPTSNPQLVFNAIDGEGLIADCTCEGGDEDAPCIRRLSGVPPDDHDNIDLEGNDCLEVEPGENAVILKDTCSDPCCGCEELQVITTTLQMMLNQVHSLENLASRIDSAIFQIQTNLLASKMNTPPCEL